MQNPIQMISELKNFMNSYNGKDPQAEAMQMIQRSGMSQAELNKMQEQANTLYNMCQSMGILK